MDYILSYALVGTIGAAAGIIGADYLKERDTPANADVQDVRTSVEHVETHGSQQ